jgi:hypothetical protein
MPRKSRKTSRCKRSLAPTLRQRKRRPEVSSWAVSPLLIPTASFSEIGHITKGELAEYYAGIASLILPHIARRPLSLLRCPSGIDKQFAARSMASTSGSSALRLGIASSING